MTVLIRLPALFADRIEGVNRIEVQAKSASDALRALVALHPQLRSMVLTRDGAINPAVVVFLNDTQLSPSELESSVGEGDQLEVVPAIEGG